MSECEVIWAAVQGKLLEQLDRDSYERYIKGIVPLAYDQSQQQMTLGVMNDFVAVWLESNYKSIINESLTSLTGVPFRIVFAPGHSAQPESHIAATRRIAIPVPPAADTPSAPKASATGEMLSNAEAFVEPITDAADADEAEAEVAIPAPSQADPDDGIELPYGHTPVFSFDTFVEGANNRICLAAAKAVANKPGRAYNPLFIFGASGMGKTHLLRAIQQDYSSKRKRPKVQYITSEEFLNLYIEALQNKTLPSFRRHFRSLDLLLIDDVQFFSGKVGLSEEFFHTFNTLHGAHKQIIMACDRQPREISGLEERLVSRFEWGLSAEVLPPYDIETRVAILRQKQHYFDVQLPNEVLIFIGERIQSNIRTLESALKKLVMHMSAFDCEMTIELAAELLQEKFETETAKQVSIEDIQRRVADHFDIRVGDMLSKKRPANIATPRMVAMYLSRQLTKKSLPHIGEAFNRNHATVINAVNTIDRKMQADESLKSAVGILTRQLRS